MKNNIHPAWSSDVVVTCACGNTFLTGSSLANITVDICSNCHPFFTGEMKFVDRQGRVDRFAAKMSAAKAHQQASSQKTKAKQQKQQAKSYQDILRDQQIELKKAEAAA